MPVKQEKRLARLFIDCKALITYCIRDPVCLHDLFDQNLVEDLLDLCFPLVSQRTHLVLTFIDGLAELGPTQSAIVCRYKLIDTICRRAKSLMSVFHFNFQKMAATFVDTYRRTQE